MKNNDDLQFMPMMHGRVQYTNDEFKRTNIKSGGQKKGTVRWNCKKFVTTMILTGSVFAFASGGIYAFNTMKGAPMSQEEVLATNDYFEVHPEEHVNRVVVDYKVKNGDTLDGIMYKYCDSSQKSLYEPYVLLYNDIKEPSLIQAGDVITLVGVPEEDADELNTGYNSELDKNDEISIELNAAVQDMVQEATKDGNTIATGSLEATIIKELEVYNATTNIDTRKHLSHLMLEQLSEVKDYSMDNTSGRSR